MLNEFLMGTLMTISLTLLGLLGGFCFALILTGVWASKNKIVCSLVNFYITFFRGVPLLVQIFLLYYGCAEFDWIRSSIFWPALSQPFVCATLALALNSAAYTTVLLKNAVQAIPTGDIEISQTLNLSFFHILRYIIWPKVLLNIWPAYSNEAIMVLKSTSLVSAITLVDLMGATKQMIATSYQTFEVLMITSTIYLTLSVLLLGFFKCLKRFYCNRF